MTQEFDFERRMATIASSRNQKRVQRAQNSKRTPPSRPQATEIIELASRFIDWNISNNIEPSAVQKMDLTIGLRKMASLIIPSLSEVTVWMDWEVSDTEKIVSWSEGPQGGWGSDGAVPNIRRQLLYASRDDSGVVNLFPAWTGLRYGVNDLANLRPTDELITGSRDAILDKVAELSLQHSLDPHTF